MTEAFKEETSDTATVVEPLTTPSESDKVVDEWFVEMFHNHGHTVEEYNRVYEGINVLKSRLNAVGSK